MKKAYLKPDGAGTSRDGSKSLIDRRHLLKFLGGSALGTALSPLPWKVLDDVSIWTQNWSWIPVPAKGETVIRHTTCGLCPVGCGVKVRCVGTQPVALSGLPGHPTSRGFLCPGGLLGHHLPYAPQRVTQPLRLANGKKESLLPEQAVSELGKTIARLKTESAAGRVAIIDSVPGRSTSIAYRQFLAQFPGGIYIAQDDETKRALRVFDGIGTAAFPELGIDLGRAGTILSFGADFTGGWGTPGALSRKRQTSETGPRLIQIEPRYSNTAATADSWLPVRPGCEALFTLGLAGVILKERLFDSSASTLVAQLDRVPEFHDLLDGFSPALCAEACGISLDAIVATARQMNQRGPCLALLGDNSGGSFDDGDYLAVNLLNVLAGAVGREGGIVARRRLPGSEADTIPATDLSQVPDHSIAFLIFDETVGRPAIPSSLVQRKLIPGKAVVVSLSAGCAYSHLANYVLPAPLYLETALEIPAAPTSPVASLSFSVPLSPAPPPALSPVEWMNRLAQGARLEWRAISDEKEFEARTKAIWETRRGAVHGYAEGVAKPSSDFASADEMAKAFKAGACWLDSPAEPVALNLSASAYLKPETWGQLKRLLNQRVEVTSSRDGDRVTLVPFTAGVVTGIASPLAGKLTHESDLYPRPGDAFVSPSTAGRLALEEGQRAELETAKGRLPVRVRLDETAMPGVVFVAVNAGTECEMTDEGVRATPAKLRRSDV